MKLTTYVHIVEYITFLDGIDFMNTPRRYIICNVYIYIIESKSIQTSTMQPLEKLSGFTIPFIQHHAYVSHYGFVSATEFNWTF